MFVENIFENTNREPINMAMAGERFFIMMLLIKRATLVSKVETVHSAYWELEKLRCAINVKHIPDFADLVRRK